MTEEYNFKPDEFLLSSYPARPTPWSPYNPIGITAVHIPTGLRASEDGGSSSWVNREIALTKLWKSVQQHTKETEMSDKHKHKHIKLAWANGENVQRQLRIKDAVWVDWGSEDTLNLELHMYTWRIKPKTININGHEVPEPLREITDGEGYWLADTGDEDYALETSWEGTSTEYSWLRRGLCHATKEAAQAHAKATVSFTELK